MAKLKDVLGEDGYAELTSLVEGAKTSDMPAWQKVLLGTLKSKLVWLGGAIITLPDLIPLISPELEEMLTPDMYKRWMRLAGLLVIVLRFYTKKSIPEKGASTN